MRKEENATDLAAHFSDVWTHVQALRSDFFRTLVLKAWRRLFRRAAPRKDRSIGNARHYLGAQHVPRQP